VNSLFPKVFDKRGVGLQWVCRRILEAGKDFESAIEIISGKEAAFDHGKHHFTASTGYSWNLGHMKTRKMINVESWREGGYSVYEIGEGDSDWRRRLASSSLASVGSSVMDTDVSDDMDTDVSDDIYYFHGNEYRHSSSSQVEWWPNESTEHRYKVWERMFGKRVPSGFDTGEAAKQRVGRKEELKKGKELRIKKNIQNGKTSSFSEKIPSSSEKIPPMARILTFLGDTSDPDWPVWRNTSKKDDDLTEVTGLFDLSQGDLHLFMGNPKDYLAREEIDTGRNNQSIWKRKPTRTWNYWELIYGKYTGSEPGKSEGEGKTLGNLNWDPEGVTEVIYS